MSDCGHGRRVTVTGELQPLPPEEGATFANSGATIVLPSEMALPTRAMFAALCALLAALAGIWVGLDYLDADDGMYTHRQFIYAQAQGAPDGSATLSGVLYDSEGTPLANHSVMVLTQSGQVRDLTDAEGRFTLEELDPGVQILDIDSPDQENFRNRILLTPPAAFEPIGFTHLEFSWPDEAAFDSAEEESGNRWIDLSHDQRLNSTEPYDATAGAMYDMFGSAFIGLGLLTLVLTGLGIRQRSPGLIRSAAITGFFSMGHIYVACCFGALGFLLTLFLVRDE